MTMELGAVALRLGMARDAGRVLGLIAHAFEKFKDRIEDDLINAHRRRATDLYRGPQRLVQLTLDCLGKLCFTAQQLALAKPPDTSSTTELFPAIDRLIPFDERNAGVWMFREGLAFQLPLVSGLNADYVPWLHGRDCSRIPWTARCSAACRAS